MSRRIKSGDRCAVDPTCDIGLKEYKVSEVRVMKKIFPNRFLCAPLSPIVFPVEEGNHALRYFVIHKSYLSKINDDKEVVVRVPINMPAFTYKDRETIERAIKALSYRSNDDDLIRSLKMIQTKIAYVEEFNDVEGI